MENRAPSRLALQDRYDVTYYRLALDLRDLDGQWLYIDLTADVTITEGPLDVEQTVHGDGSRGGSLRVRGASQRRSNRDR